MRSDPSGFQLVAPTSLQAVVSLLANEPGGWLPIAGGTDVMVQYATGKLPTCKLVSIWNLPELRRIDVETDEVNLGAACTYADVREHNVVASEFPLLASAAGWTGGIANQNRGTLGGNIANASPAADSLPALLAYEAELVLVSVRGERRLPYLDFHTGYKTTRLAPDELVRAICLPRRFSEYLAYTRKVGARNAQAISKVCIAALGRMNDGVVTDIRIALGSVAPVPIRLAQTEQVVTGKRIEPSVLLEAKKSAVAEIRPIDDIRSTVRYRAAVAANLVAEFLNKLSASGPNMIRPNRSRTEANTDVLERWNRLPPQEALQQVLPCCGSQAWADELVKRKPIMDRATLLAASDEIWRSLTTSDWMEAFRNHPRIGESRAPQSSSAQSSSWSSQEQQKVADAPDAAKIALAQANRAYEARFGHIFIVCASGQSAAEILEILQRRLHNDKDTELREAAEQQRQITQIRLNKWLSE
jgi:OHCU decarboxylase